MYAHLKSGKKLPPSQVVHTTPAWRHPRIGATDLGRDQPAGDQAPLPTDDRIRFSAQTLSVPE